jgi:3-oxoacyl-[acyl-carrier-protein] synthase-3
MAFSTLNNLRVKGISTCVPPKRVSNTRDVPGMDPGELRKVVAMAGVEYRHVSDGSITSTDLCRQACGELMAEIGWSAESVDALVLVTQSPDYFLPSSSCLVHRDLGFPTSTATFDVGLGCSGYPYGLWLGAMMLNSGLDRIIVMHGETPSLFCHPDDHATSLLFGDAGSATAMERSEGTGTAHFSLHTDGQGFADLIIPGRGFRESAPEGSRDRYLFMNGPNIFSFSIKRVPAIIEEMLARTQLGVNDIDYFVLHQSNRFIMKHLAKKCSLDPDKVPIILEDFGNAGGPSVPLAITQGIPAQRPSDSRILAIGYGVGLSWSASLFDLEATVSLTHSVYDSSNPGVEGT